MSEISTPEKKTYELSFFQKMAMSKVTDLMDKSKVKQIVLERDNSELGVKIDALTDESVLIKKSYIDEIKNLYMDKCSECNDLKFQLARLNDVINKQK